MKSRQPEQAVCKSRSANLGGHLRDILIVIIIGHFVSLIFNFKFAATWTNFMLGSLYSAIIGGTLWKGNEFIAHWLSIKINDFRQPHKVLRWKLITMFVYTLIAIISINYIWFVLIFDWTARELFSKGLPTMIVEFVITVVITSIFFSIGFFKAWRDSAVNEEKLEKESIKLLYNALKNQVNPHFLFNSLNTLTTLVYKDADLAAAFIKQLADVYRYVLEHRETELVRLSEELAFCKTYVNLHKIRHADHLLVNFDFSENMGLHVVPLSLQILIENAIKHNEISEENPLEINIGRDGDYIVISNNYQPRMSIPDSQGIGLDTLRKRYAHLTVHPLLISQEMGLYKVSVPLLKSDES